ncbi:MAG TPA: hypothetical protein ENH82_14330 [bacterium]|nr:hypothetical protein [bacterium]
MAIEGTEHKLPGLDVELYEYKNYHRLKLKSKTAKEYKWTKSVTTITNTLDKPALPAWYAKMVMEELKSEVMPDPESIEYESRLDFISKAGDRARDHAALVGTQAHEMIAANASHKFGELIGEGQEPEAFAAFSTFLEWADLHKMKPILWEQVVGSIKFDFAGILDMICKLLWKGKEIKALIDFKTSNAVYPSGFGQIGGYWQALRESFPDIAKTLDMGIILNFRRDGSPMDVYAFTLDEMEDAVKFFGNLRRSKAGLDDAAKLLKSKKGV